MVIVAINENLKGYCLSHFHRSIHNNLYFFTTKAYAKNYKISNFL